MKSALLVKGNKSSGMSADEAQVRNERRLWCPDCGEIVRLHKKGKAGRPAAHFEHLDHAKAMRDGCKLAYQGYGKS